MRNLSLMVSRLCALLIVAFPAVVISEVPPTPKLEISAPIFDFGSVAQGTKVSHEFSLKNVGTGTLFIQRIVPACGCTAASLSGDALNPGQEGKLKVELDTADFSGEKLKMVRIFTNDGENPAAAVSLKGKIDAKVQVEPSRIFFGDLVRADAGSWETRQAQVRVGSGTGVKIDGIQSVSNLVEAKVLEKKDDLLRLAVKLSPLAPLGELRERIIINLTDARGPYSINLPIYAVVKGALKLSPATISFGIIEGEALLERSVKLDNLGLKAIETPSLVSSDPALQVELKTVEAGRKYVLRLRLNPKLVKKDLRASVSVNSNLADEPGLVLNVFGIRAPLGL
jgi:hypothetical protein